MTAAPRKDKFKWRLEIFPKGRFRCSSGLFFFHSPRTTNSEVQECTLVCVRCHR